MSEANFSPSNENTITDKTDHTTPDLDKTEIDHVPLSSDPMSLSAKEAKREWDRVRKADKKSSRSLHKERIKRAKEVKRGIKSTEKEIKNAEMAISKMRKWLIKDGTYKPEEVDEIISKLEGAYDEWYEQTGIWGSLDLSRLTSASGLALPQNLYGSLNLNSLTTIEGISFPQYIEGSLELNSLTSAKDLDLPQHVNGSIGLRGLTSSEGISFPVQFNDLFYIYLDSLNPTEMRMLQEQHPDLPFKFNWHPTKTLPTEQVVNSPEPESQLPELTVDDASANFTELQQRLLELMPIEGLSIHGEELNYRFETYNGSAEIILDLDDHRGGLTIRKATRSADGSLSSSLHLELPRLSGLCSAEFNFIVNEEWRQTKLERDQIEEIINKIYDQLSELAVRREGES